MTFTHSIAQIPPYRWDFPDSSSGNLSNNRFSQYTSYNGDIYLSTAIIRNVDLDLYYDFFGDNQTDNINSSSFSNFNYIFDIYQLDQSIPNLQDILSYRYGSEFWGYKTYNGGKKLRNLGRYKVQPDYKSGFGKINISNTLRAHEKVGNIVTDIRNMLMESSANINSHNYICDDTSNNVRWLAEFGFEVNPGLTFSDTVSTNGTYSNPVTNQPTFYSLGFTFSYPHNLKYGDEISITMNNLALNRSYNGFAYVVGVINDYHIVVDKLFDVSSVSEGGRVDYLLRINEIQSGNWWKYYASQDETSPYSSMNVNEDKPCNNCWNPPKGRGFMSGMQINNLSIDSVYNLNTNPIFNNRGQLSYAQPGGVLFSNRSDLLNNDINDIGRLLINRDNYNRANDKPQFFLTNWNDETMGLQELHLFKLSGLTFSGYSIDYLNSWMIPDYTLGVLNHNNYWPAYFRGFSDDGSLPTDYGDKLSTVATFDTIRYILNSNGTQTTIDLPISKYKQNVDAINDYEKLEAIISSKYSIWAQPGFTTELENLKDGDTLTVQLVKAYNPNWDFSKTGDTNVLIDFDGIDANEEELEAWKDDGYPLQIDGANDVSPYPFHLQFTDLYDGGGKAQFKGPFGTLQNPNVNQPKWDPKDYNFWTSSQFDPSDANWPISATATTRGWWWSELNFSTTDVSFNDGIRTIYMTKLNELWDENLQSKYNMISNEKPEALRYPYFPAGLYSMDYAITGITGSDIHQFNFSIGTDASDTKSVVGLYLDEEVTTDGGNLGFSTIIDPNGSMKIRPFKLRHKRDLVLAEKKFKLIINCNTPYIKQKTEFDYGGKVELMFKNRLGSYERCWFNCDTTQKVNIRRTNYMTGKSTDNWGLYESNKFSKTPLSTTTVEQWTINSDWKSENQYMYYEELITSPEVYVVKYFAPIENFKDKYEGLTQSYNPNPNSKKAPEYFEFVPILITENEFTRKSNLREGIFNLQLTFEKSNQTNYQ
jgi:hypothetical protein